MGAWAGAASKIIAIHPNTKWLWVGLGFPIGIFLFLKSKMVWWTSRVKIFDEGEAFHGPAIYVNWHRHLPYLIAHHGARGRWMMVSRAPYMTPIAIWCSLMGLKLARGATGCGGREALSELGRAISAGGSASIAVDGPAGPGFAVKRGCIDLARETNAPIIPIAYSCKRGRASKSRWDKMLVPKLFDQIDLRYGSPIYINANSTDIELQGRIRDALISLDPTLAQ